MKKLMMLGVVALVTMSASAANFKWSAKGLYNSGTETLIASGTAYLFVADVTSQQAALTALKGATSASDWLVANSDASLGISAGTIAATVSSVDNAPYPGTYSFYFAVLSSDSKSVYFSNVLTGKGAQQGSTATTVPFGAQATGSKLGIATGSSVAESRWNSLSSVPEPTSGLLVMLGVGLMALRRRRV